MRVRLESLSSMVAGAVSGSQSVFGVKSEGTDNPAAWVSAPSRGQAGDSGSDLLIYWDASTSTSEPDSTVISIQTRLFMSSPRMLVTVPSYGE